MPLVLNPDEFIPVPPEVTYAAGWEGLPGFWREVVEGTRQP